MDRILREIERSGVWDREKRTVWDRKKRVIASGKQILIVGGEVLCSNGNLSWEREIIGYHGQNSPFESDVTKIPKFALLIV